MPAFSDVTDFLTEVNGEPLDLPLRGQVFRFSGSPPMAQVAELREVHRKLEAMARGELPANTVIAPNEEEFYDRLLGDQLPGLMAVGATQGEKAHIATTVLFYYLRGADVAEQYWKGDIHRAARERASGEAQPTGKTTTASPKANRPSAGGKRTTGSSRSSKRTSPTAASTASA